MDRFRRGENVVRDLTCAECGTAFASVRRDARFCTRRCSNRWHNARRQPRNRLVAEPVVQEARPPIQLPALTQHAGWPKG